MAESHLCMKGGNHKKDFFMEKKPERNQYEVEESDKKQVALWTLGLKGERGTQ